MLQRSKLSIAQDYKEHSKDRLEELKQLTVIPTLQRFGIIIFEFKAKNNGRTRTHQHLFMMDEEAKSITEGDNSLKMAVSKVPIDDWAALLERRLGANRRNPFLLRLTGQEAIYTL